MSVLYVKSSSNDPTVAGSFLNVLSIANDGDVIAADSDYFTGTFCRINVDGGGIVINKSVTINPGNGKRFVFIGPDEIASDRFLRIAGTSAAPVTVTIYDCWLNIWNSTASGVGVINVNYATFTATRCIFANVSNESTTKGFYASNSSVKLNESIVIVPSNYAVNFAASATVELNNCTIAGTVKSGAALNDCAVITPDAVSSTLVSDSWFMFSPISDATIATGRTTAIGCDLYGNQIAAGGAVGALGACAADCNTTAEFDATTGRVFFWFRETPNRLIVDGDALPLAFSSSRVEPLQYTPGTVPFVVYCEKGDEPAEMTVDALPDYNWYRAAFSSLDIPVQEPEEMAAIIPNYKTLLKG